MARRQTSLEYLFLVNAAGGLLYSLCWGTAKPLSENDAIRMASTFHSLHAISEQISPVGRGGGIVELEASGLSIRCLQSESGLKIFCTCAPGTPHVMEYLKQVYVLYVDWVLKDPFYEVDMPIRVDKFETKLRVLTTERFKTG